MNNTTQKMSPVKKTLMELVMLGEYGVSDKVGICEFIERMDDNQIDDLTKDIIMLENYIGNCKIFLEFKYNEELQKKNSSVFMTESLFSNRRDSIILQEADGDSQKIDLKGAIEMTGVTGGAMWYMKTGVTNPPEANRQMVNLRRSSLDMYHAVAGAIFNLSGRRIILPQLSRTDAQLRNLHNVHQAASEKMKAGIPYDKSMDDAAKRAELKVKAARRIDLKKSIKGIEHAGHVAGLAVLSLMGTTALALLATHIYQKYLSDAAKNCRGKSGTAKELCINTFKISACDAAIQKCREALPGCKDKNNPEKCTHSIQTQIWNFERRKKLYQQKMVSVTKRSLTPPRHPSTFEPEDMPSKSSKKSSGVVKVF